MKYIVTGATSMIGIALINELLINDKDALIYAVVRPGSGNLCRLTKDARIVVIECNIDSYCKLSSLIKDDCDVFYHLAWTSTGNERNSSALVQASNILYSLESFYQAEKLHCKKYIGAGSQAEYGLLNEEVWHTYSPCSPTQLYGIAKYATGRTIMELSKNSNMICYWVRIFSVYGSNDRKGSLISSLISNIQNNIPMPLSSGDQFWDYLYEKDAGKALSLLGIKGPAASKLYCLGSGKSCKLREYITIIRNMINPNYCLQFGALEAKNGITRIKADIEELKKDINWEPVYSFREGISEVIKK